MNRVGSCVKTAAPMNLSVEALIRAHLPAVHHAARSLKKLVGQRADYDDLVGYGMLGLVKAARAHDTSREFNSSFAETVARSAMLDGLKKEWGRRGDTFREQPVSLEQPVSSDPEAATLGDLLPDPAADVVRSVEALETLVEFALDPPTRKRSAARSRKRPAARSLSPIELAVLAHAARGDSAAETAAKLGKSLETVKTHRCHVIAKLGARDTMNAVYLATRAGLFEEAA